MLRLFLCSLFLLGSVVHAQQKLPYSENDSDFSNISARSGKGFASACYQNSGIALAKGKGFREGKNAIVLSSSSDISSFVQKLKKKKRKNKANKAKKSKISAQIKSVQQASKRCSSSGGGGSGGGSGFINPPVSQAAIGTNLDFPTHFSPEIKYCDLFKNSLEWAPTTNGVFGQGSLEKRSDGYPTSAPQGSTIASSLVATDQQGLRIPEGTYTLSFDGEGLLNIDGDGVTEEVFRTGGTYQVDVRRAASGIFFSIIESSASNPIRNIKFVMPGFADTCDDNPFYPPFIEFLEEFTVVRTMNLLQTNDAIYPCDNGVAVTSPSCEKDWDLRVTPDYQTQTGVRGTALEHLVDMANESTSDLWINVPHAATANWMRQAARLVCGRLNDRLRLYVEYSNEVWNSNPSFPQSQWAANSERAAGLSQSGDPIAGQRFFVRRNMEMFEIFEDVCGSNRLVKVLGGFSAISRMNELNLQDFANSSINTSNIQPDALAIAFYTGVFTVDYLIRIGQADSADVDTMIDLMTRNVTEVLDLQGDTEESLESQVQENEAFASASNIPLITYEAGQHLTTQTFENPEGIGATVVATNRDSRMFNVYQRLLDTWFNNGGGLLMHFSGVSRYSNSEGAFGSKEYFSQPLSEAPKFRALIQRQSQLGN